MESLAAEGSASPHSDKYLRNREAAAAAMARLSRDLFAEILQQVLSQTVSTLVPETPAK